MCRFLINLQLNKYSLVKQLPVHEPPIAHQLYQHCKHRKSVHVCSAVREAHFKGTGKLKQEWTISLQASSCSIFTALAEQKNINIFVQPMQ